MTVFNTQPFRLTRDMSDLEVREHLDSRELDKLLQKLEKADSETQLGLIVF